MKRWLGKQKAKPSLSEAQLARRQALPVDHALTDTPLDQQRIVVLDLETSGLNTRRDQLLSIGAVVIEQGVIDLGQQFEATLQSPVQALGDSVLIHRIVPAELARGQPPAEALLAFMEFLADSPVLAFHAPFDRRMLERALQQHLDYRLRHVFVDVAEMAAMLCPQTGLPQAGLDDWIRHFGLAIHQRHHAAADALVTAELALILLARARQQCLGGLAMLERQLRHWRQQPHTYSF